MNKVKKSVKIFNIPIVCSRSTSLADYNKQNLEEGTNMNEALDEGYEIIASHSLTLADAGYIVFVLYKEVEVDSNKQVEQENL